MASGNMTYDEIGNPLTYYNGSSYSFTWEEGRQLASVTTGNNNTYTYKYNQDGVRIEKTVGTLRYEYTVSGTRIEREKIFDGSALIKDSYFYYDASGIPCSAKIYVYNGTSRSEYNLILESNIQGDITDIYTADGTLLVSYTYGAWGQIHVKYAISDSTLSNLAIDVPFKYRGYYHDQETSFYYLNSRYYDPYAMRFINADGYVSTGQGLNGNNMYAYCNNNPVSLVDKNGNFAEAIGSFFQTAIREAGKALTEVVPGILATVGSFISDGPAPYGDALGLVVGAVTVAVFAGITIKGISDSLSSEKDKADELAETDSSKEYRYWTASIVDGVVIQGKPLTYVEAREWAAAENDLLCKDHAAAIGIVKFYPSAIWEPAHGGGIECGYLNHYHLSKAHNNHIWYYGE